MNKNKKTKKSWKTKTRDNRIYMICQNSDLAFSKYPEFSPEDGTSTCDKWEEVAKNTAAVLCSKCTHRSTNF